MFSSQRLLVACLSASLVACGGGGAQESSLSASSAALAPETVADDGLARFNYWRAQLGLSNLVRDSDLDAAAQAHSNYQAVNDVISHYQVPGAPGFTGECLGDTSSDARCSEGKVSRLEQAGYAFSQGGYAFGEVISKTFNRSGSSAADALVAAIYHRFVIFEPMFKEAGAGAANSASGATYFTTNFAADGLDSGIGAGKIVVYPFDGQQGVARSFSSDQEVPDPVPSRDLVGYPISVHADIYSGSASTVVNVQSFTVRPQGGSALQVQRLWPSVDAHTPGSAAAIVPLNVLAPNTVYQVQFSGTVGNVPVTRSWSFTTGS